VRYIVETGSADGIILNQTRPDDPRIRYLTERGMAFAAHGRTDMGIEHAYFDFDNETFSRLAVQALVRRGRKRLLLVAPPLGQSYARHMVTGFSDQAAICGTPFEILDTVSSDAGSIAIKAAVRARFAAANPPDGVLLGSTTAAMASVAGAEARL
jgi:LacI family transcriptional regulator